MSNAYKTYQPPQGEGGGLFLKLNDGDQVKIRIAEEPVVYIDKWGNTRYAWAVYNHETKTGQVFQQSVTGYRSIAALAQDEDWGDPSGYDIKVSREGSTQKNTRYHMSPVPNGKPLTEEQKAEVEKVDIKKAIPNGISLSEAAKGKEPEPPAEQEDNDESSIDMGEFKAEDMPPGASI